VGTCHRREGDDAHMVAPAVETQMRMVATTATRPRSMKTAARGENSGAACCNRAGRDAVEKLLEASRINCEL